MHGAHHRGAGWHYGFHPQQQTIDENEETSVPSLKLPREGPRAISANQPTTATDLYSDSKLALVDSASSAHGHHFAGGAAEDAEQMEAMDLAALGRLLPDLDGDCEQQPSSSGRPPAAASSMAAAAAAGAPGSGRGGMRRRVGSTASVEEDIFSSVGGLELGHDLSGPDAAGSAAAAAAAEQLLAGASSAAAGSLSMPSVASLADLAPVDTPSRTLFVQNVAVDVPDDELRQLFSSHGDLRTLYTACKARGLVIVGYFDLRSAIAAATQLSGYPLAGRHLEVAFSAPKKGETNQVNQGVVVVYNLDPDTTEEQLVWIFSRFGDVKDIQQAPMRSNQKFIEFWDVRHAATALRAMNRAELSRLPAAGPSLSAGPAAAGGSSSALAGMVGHEQEAAGGSRPRGLSGDGSAARTGDGGASSSSSHAYAAAQVAAAMQQLEMEQQQQQLPFQRSPGQPIPRPPSHDPQVQMAMQHADALQQQVAQRGMVRPVSGMLDRMQAAVSPPLNLGPLSQSWDTSGNPGSLVGLLNRQQQQQQQPGQQQQQQQSMLQQQQQQLLLQQLASGLLRGSRTDLSGLDPVIETDNGDELQKLLMGSSSGAAAAAAAGAAAANAARPAGPAGNTGMHVSDSASSIASTQGNVFGAGMGTGVLPGGAHAAGVHSIHHGPFGPQVSGMPGPSGTQAFGNQQQMGPGAAAAAAAAAAASSSNLHRSFGSSDQLHSMEQLMQQQAAAGVGGHDDQGNAAGLGVLGNSMSSNNLAAVAAAAGLSANAAASLGLGNSMASASFDSGLNLMDQHHQAGGLGGLLGSYPYLSNAGDASAAGGLYRGAAGPGGRSLSHPCLSMSAMAAMAAQQQAQQQHQQQNAAAAAAAAAVAGRLFGQQNAAAAAALLQAQAQAAGLSNLQDFQQQQHQHMALQQLLQANLHAQQLAGAANLHAAQQALLQAGMHPQQLAAAGLLNPASLAGLGLPASSSYGTLHNLGALQLQSAAAAAASAAAAAAAGGSGIPRGASTGSLTGLGGMDGRGHRGGDGGAGSSGGSRGGGRLSRRAADPAVEAERKAQQERLFALDVDRIMSGEDKRTTLMIKNIPNKYTQKMLLQTIEEQFKGTFDFFYLPIDFKNKCNVGYAFINMLKPQYIPPLVVRFNNKRWDKFNSEKVCNISYGRIQGRSALISHFQNSSLMHEDKRCRPVLFISEGPDAGEPEPFPMGVHARPRGAGAGGSGSGGSSSGHLAGTERSPRVSSSGTISASGSGAGGSLAGSRPGSSTALAAAAAGGGVHASAAGSDHGLASSSSHGGSGGGLAATAGAGAAGSSVQRELQAPPPGLGGAPTS